MSDKALDTNYAIKEVERVVDKLFVSGSTLTLEYIKKSVLETIKPNKYRYANDRVGNIIDCIEDYFFLGSPFIRLATFGINLDLFRPFFCHAE